MTTFDMNFIQRAQTQPHKLYVIWHIAEYCIGIAPKEVFEKTIHSIVKALKEHFDIAFKRDQD